MGIRRARLGKYVSAQRRDDVTERATNQQAYSYISVSLRRATCSFVLLAATTSLTFV